MSQHFEVQAEERNTLGKGHSRRIRRLSNKIPAIIYGAGADPVAVALDHNKIQKALENEAFYSHILTIDISGKQEKAILRAIQRHPYKPRIMHMDFLRISAKEKLTMNVPLHFIGEEDAPGVKLHGGTISHLLNNVEVSCLPADLPEYIEVDISDLNVDQAVHLSNLKLPQGVELVELGHGRDNDLSVVSIHLPRVAEDSEKATPVTEVITEKEPKTEASNKKE
jgi:large subunit ribosomal protein L25